MRSGGVRLGVLGASSVKVTPDGPRLFDISPRAPEIRSEVKTGPALLDLLEASPESLDWFYVSPAAVFGAWNPQKVTGRYRINEGILLKDDNGESYISAADLALAIVDEIERPPFRR